MGTRVGRGIVISSTRGTRTQLTPQEMENVPVMFFPTNITLIGTLPAWLYGIFRENNISCGSFEHHEAHDEQTAAYCSPVLCP